MQIMLNDYISKVGHHWIVNRIVENEYIVRFSKTNNPLSANNGSDGGWRHGMTLEYFNDLDKERRQWFDEYFGTPYLIHIKYGEVVGVAGWDVTFKPDDVLDFVEI